jgi:hypothetical protein
VTHFHITGVELSDPATGELIGWLVGWLVAVTSSMFGSLGNLISFQNLCLFFYGC